MKINFMRYFYFLLFFTVFSGLKSVNAQSEKDLCGNWFGIFPNKSFDLRMAMVLSCDSSVLKAKLTSIDQGNTEIIADAVTFDSDSVKINFKKYKIKYHALLNKQKDSLIGEWIQGGSIKLCFAKVDSFPVPKHPQEPKAPFPYKIEEVTFTNTKENIILSGTLTYPETGGVFPAVVLVSGSGQQNRDEELLGHKPFAVIADYLTRNGIAVLRYDDRGVGKSGGNPSKSTSLDFSYDAEAAFEFLKTNKNIDPKKIGFIGHSEGGMIAPLVASRNKNVAFVVMLAGPGVSGKNILLAQSELISKSMGIPDDSIKWSSELNKKLYEAVLQNKDNTKAVEAIKKIIANETATWSEAEKKAAGLDMLSVSNNAYALTLPWMRYFLAFNPAKVLRKVKCPVLAVNGSKDLQVPCKENLNAIESVLKKSGNKNVVVKEFAGLNHLFQQCETGSPSEYAKIEMTFSVEVLEMVNSWILSLK